MTTTAATPTPTLTPIANHNPITPIVNIAAAPATIPYCCVCDGLLTPDGAGCVCEPGYAAIIGAPIVRECKPAELCEDCDRYHARGYRFDPASDRAIPRCKRCFDRGIYEERKRWGDLPDHSALECDIFGKRPEDYAAEAEDEFDVDGDLDAEDIGYRRTPLERQMDDYERDMEEGESRPDWSRVELTYGGGRDLG